MYRTLLSVLFSCILFCTNGFAQSCEECKQRTIIIYDNNVTVPVPDYNSMPVNEQQAAYSEWINLYYIVGGVKKYANEDASADCFMRLCSAFFTQTDSINTSIKFGQGYPNTAPSGSVASGDYIISGVVTGNSAGYSLQLNLETANSREVVKSAVVNFSKGYDPFQIGYNAASSFGTLYNTCLDFEKKKRDEGDPYAIRPEIKAVPQKTSLKRNESTEVEFTLKDCDEQPLKNRKIDLTADNGSFDPQSITTDDNGKAKAKFTAGDNTGVAKINGVYAYRMPTESSSLSASDDGTSYIEIESGPNWKVWGDFEFSEMTYFDQSIGENTKVHKEYVNKHSGMFLAELDMKSWGSGRYSTNNTVKMDVYGTCTETFNENDNGGASDEHTYAYTNTVKTSKCQAVSSDDNQEVNITLSSDGRHIAFTNNVKDLTGGGQSNTYSIYCQDGNCFTSTPSEIIECDYSPFQDGTHSYEINRAGSQDTTYTITETPSPGYTITHKIHQVWKENGINIVFQYKDDGTEELVQGAAKQTTVSKEYIEIEVNDPSLTGVSDKDKIIVPENYLYQNNPNPFNPSTVISYSLKKAGVVKLSVFDILGREVKVLVNTYQNAGNHLVKFNAAGLNSGVYFYKIDGNGFTAVKKMLLLK